jgi:hypothetical protein
LKALKELEPHEYAATKRKNGFYASYSEWSKLPPQNQNKVLAFWNLLENATKQKVIRAALAVAREEVEVELQRRPPTAKGDLCRLLELRKYPDAMGFWAATETSMNRRQLDSRKSNAPGITGAPMVEENDPWGSLANIFNDYTRFCPQNCLIQYKDVLGVPTAISPYKPSHQKYTALAAHCYDINPSDPARAIYLRDGAWIKEHWRNLRAMLTPVYLDFNRSGRQSDRDEAETEWMSEEECTRWIFHSNNKHRKFPVVMMYSYAVLDKSDFEQLGKIMEDGVGKDYSAHCNGSHEQAEARRVKRRRLSRDVDDGVAEALRQGNRAAIQLESLKFIVQHGTELQKRDALNEIMKLSQLRTSRSPPPEEEDNYASEVDSVDTDDN